MERTSTCLLLRESWDECNLCQENFSQPPYMSLWLLMHLIPESAPFEWHLRGHLWAHL